MKEFHCFCGQIFDDIIDQNAHILTHFDQKHCIGCDNQLIYVAGKWYQPHTDLNCNAIKVEPEQGHLNIEAPPLEENVDETVAELPNIELVVLPPPKDECFDDELDNSDYIGNVDASLMAEQSIDAFYCELCQKPFKLRSSQIRHQKMCTGISKYQPRSLSALPVWVRAKPFECELCSKAFQLKSSLRRHRKLCDNRPVDGIDDASLMTESGSNQEMQQSEGSPLDDSEMVEVDDIQVIQQNQNRQLDASTSLGVQPSKFSSGGSSMGDQTEKLYKCEFCPKEFKHKPSRRRHRKLCLNRPGEQSSAMGLIDFDANQMIHSSQSSEFDAAPSLDVKTSEISTDGTSMADDTERPFKCEYCPKAFKHKPSRRRHRKLCEHRPVEQSSAMDLIDCDESHRSQSSKSSLLDDSEMIEFDDNQAIQQNQNSQLGAPNPLDVRSPALSNGGSSMADEAEKPYKCEFCPRMFKLISSRQRHRKVCENRPDEDDPEQLEYEAANTNSEYYYIVTSSELNVNHTPNDETSPNAAEPSSNDEPPQSTSFTASDDQMRQNTLKKYACKGCPTRFKYKHCAIRHWHALHGEQADKNQRLYDTESAGEVIRDSAGMIQCNYCPATFKRLKYLGKHKRLHHRDRLTYGKFKCTKCTATFQTERSMRSHMLRHNPIKSHKMQFVCYMCHKACQFPKELSLHMRTHPNVEYKCCFDGCTSQLETNNQFYLHLLKHLQIECKQCGKYYTQIKFDSHRCTTEPTKVFICDHCGKAFSSIRLLGFHMNGHTGKKPYTCNVCNKSYTQPGGLWRHSYVHSDKSKYTCDVTDCNRAFNQDTDLYRHQFKVHGIFRKKYPCMLCDKVFPENAMLRKHLDNHETV